MDRRRFLETLAGGLLAAPLAAEAQQAATLPRIVVLSLSSLQARVLDPARRSWRQSKRSSRV